MANTAAVCTSFKAEILRAEHNLSSSGGNTFKFALYYASGSLGASTTAYSTTAEVTGSNYVAGGVTADMTNNPTTSGTVGYWTPGAAASWGTLSASTFDSTLLYNDTHTGNAGLAVYTFGSQTVTAGNFSLSMPSNTSAAALLRIA
jgi:hypothetical protein